MDMVFYIFLFIVIIQICKTNSHSSGKVLELNGNYLENRNQNEQWLLKFYAPWCSHCKRLEPIWKQVAQALSDTDIYVGRIDVTRYKSIATIFKTHLTPTIQFLAKDRNHTYNGERTLEAIADYARRMAAPNIQEISRPSIIQDFIKKNMVFFLYVGHDDGELWKMYQDVASQMKPHVPFYSTFKNIAEQDLKLPHIIPAVYVYKDSEFHLYPADNKNNDSYDADLNNPLLKWVTVERFNTFPKVSAHTIHELIKTEKYLVLVIVEENKIKQIPRDMLEFRNKVETLIRKKRDRYHKHFQFGWMGDAQLANSIAMTRLPLPYLLVLNSSTYHHHLPEDDPPQMTIEAIEAFLEMIMNKTSPVYGGKSVIINAVRKVLDMKRSLEDMWHANPVVMVVIFSLPTLFFLIILYNCCCADILDAEDDEEEELLKHHKRE